MSSAAPRIAALVPMRHGSERVPGKNHRLFAGRPLYHYVVAALLACPQIAEVVIDTDSPPIMADAAAHFPTVRLLERPEPPRGIYDSVFSGTRLQTRLWDSLTRAVNHNPAILLRTQDLPPIYEENSCMYLFARETLEARHNRVGERPLMFEIERTEAWDIDIESDFRIAELLHQLQEGAL
ncbi:MAG: acylneuraminate cytidylyltransferase family protein [Chloroflexi bacterium]|nr:acylneuraminate cytidylyltransferase family protein [Chloroflexota bacterium]